jgi:hypothetical protein
MHQPCERALHHPPAGQHHEPGHVVGAFDDLQGECEFLLRPADKAAGVAAVGPDQGDLSNAQDLWISSSGGQREGRTFPSE